MSQTSTLKDASRALKALIPQIEGSIKYMEDNGRWLPLNDDFLQAIHKFNLTNWAELYLDPKKIKALSASVFLDFDSLTKELTNPNMLRDEILKAFASDIESYDFEPPKPAEIAKFNNDYLSASKEEQVKISRDIAKLFLTFITYLFDCLSLMVYGKSLCNLVAEAKNGDDESLRMAIQIDRTIIFLPFVKNRIIKAQFDAEPEFWRKLGYRISNPIFKGKIRYRKLYLAFYILDDLNLLGLPHADILGFCRETGVFDTAHDQDDIGYLGKKLKEYKKKNLL